MIFRLLALVVFICASSTSMAQDSSQDYYRAYNTCSPAAHYLTRQACNYGVVFEQYYTNCMSRSGFGGESDATGSNYYDGYMKAYNKCYSSAEQSSQTHCNYGASYQRHYSNCMTQHNFNERGEKISANGDEAAPQEGFKFNY